MLEERVNEVETFFKSDSEEEKLPVTESLGDIFTEETSVTEDTPMVQRTPKNQCALQEMQSQYSNTDTDFTMNVCSPVRGMD